MKKSRRREYAKDRHGETCMCKKCRAQLEALFLRKKVHVRPEDYKGFAEDSVDDD